MKQFIVLFVLIHSFTLLFGQNQQDIYPDNKGTELLNLLVSDYKTSTVLSYNDARDQLWGAIALRNNDSLRCVYTGYTIYINPSASNPRTEAYNLGINCEHTWPQSLGAEGQAKSDMHHLFPTREDVNAARGNLSFNDIPDQQTDTWFRNDKQSTSIPAGHLNEWSEVDAGIVFEPREDHKGNVARAVFYFYAMYKDQSVAGFLMPYLKTLYQWHYDDPVDEEEEWRDNFIAGKQTGKHNPFVLDSTLIRRAYFPAYSGGSSSILYIQNDFNLHISQNPFTGNIIIQSDADQAFTIHLIDLQGRTLIELPTMSGRYLVLNTQDFPRGLYLLKAVQSDQVFIHKLLVR
ncbi:endonuclease [Bacteroidota bacterium]